MWFSELQENSTSWRSRYDDRWRDWEIVAAWKTAHDILYTRSVLGAVFEAAFDPWFAGSWIRMSRSAVFLVYKDKAGFLPFSLLALKVTQAGPPGSWSTNLNHRSRFLLLLFSCYSHGRMVKLVNRFPMDIIASRCTRKCYPILSDRCGEKNEWQAAVLNSGTGNLMNTARGSCVALNLVRCSCSFGEGQALCRESDTICHLPLFIPQKPKAVDRDG